RFAIAIRKVITPASSLETFTVVMSGALPLSPAASLKPAELAAAAAGRIEAEAGQTTKTATRAAAIAASASLLFTRAPFSRGPKTASSKPLLKNRSSARPDSRALAPSRRECQATFGSRSKAGGRSARLAAARAARSATGRGVGPASRREAARPARRSRARAGPGRLGRPARRRPLGRERAGLGHPRDRGLRLAAPEGARP